MINAISKVIERIFTKFIYYDMYTVHWYYSIKNICMIKNIGIRDHIISMLNSLPI